MLQDQSARATRSSAWSGAVTVMSPSSGMRDQPRRSYTQLEYEIAVELCKPVFVFVATEDCTLDATVYESDELHGLQLEHLKRIIAGDRIRMTFHSVGHLTDQVRVMRFDPESLAGVTTRLAVLLSAELVDTESLRDRRGKAAWRAMSSSRTTTCLNQSSFAGTVPCSRIPRPIARFWVARHDRTKELRVFKFCFDATRLTSFKRE